LSRTLIHSFDLYLLSKQCFFFEISVFICLLFHHVMFIFIEVSFYCIFYMTFFMITRCQIYIGVCQWLATSRWFSPGILFSPTNKTDSHVITETLLKVALNIINHKPKPDVRSTIILYISTENHKYIFTIHTNIVEVVIVW
jgi:hypothetical protein